MKKNLSLIFILMLGIMIAPLAQARHEKRSRVSVSVNAYSHNWSMSAHSSYGKARHYRSSPSYHYRYRTYARPVVVHAPMYTPVPVIYPEPQVVVRTPPPPPPAQYWHYCADASAYYPYVRQCPGGWMKVLPEPVR